MPQKVSCPNCSKELNAPDELLGQLVACPRCNHRFQVAAVPGVAPAHAGAYPPASTASATPTLPSQSAADLLPPTATASPQHARELPAPPVSGGASSSTANLERLSLGPLPKTKPNVAVPKPAMHDTDPGHPRSTGGAVTAKLAVPQPPSVDGKHSSESLATPPPASPPGGQQVAKFKGAPPSTEPPLPKPAKKEREVKQAKFVASGAVATRINLGADGQLPNLMMADVKETAEVADEQKSNSPLLMIGVLVFSVLMSVVMLFAPEGTSDAESSSKQKSTKHLEESYIGTGAEELKPHQKLLREGLQAQRRGDEKAARRAYREVLRMLRAETSGEMGLTAPKWADAATPPNDRDLEYHLNVLLADD